MFPRKLTGIVPLKCTSSAEAPFSNASYAVNHPSLLFISYQLTENICSRCKPRVAGEHMGKVGVGSIWISVFLRQSAQMQVVLRQALLHASRHHTASSKSFAAHRPFVTVVIVILEVLQAQSNVQDRFLLAKTK